MLLPSSAEFATLVETPVQEHDRPLMALLGWCDLRWSEAVSLRGQAIWRDPPHITIDRVPVRRTQKEVDADTGVGLHLLGNNFWRQEPPKAGVTATVPVPRPLWRRLVGLADQKVREDPMPLPAGRLLFRRPIISAAHTNSIGVLDNTNWRRDVWLPAREAAGLVGDESLPALDPRGYLMKEEDLRAFAASVLLDSGSSLHDRARRDVQVDKGASIGERLDALWTAWAGAFPGAISKLGMDVDNVIELKSRRSRG